MANDNSRAVSYTHLDVYKRQIQGCMQKIVWFCLNSRLLSFAIENTLVKTCLLYTSVTETHIRTY